MTIDIDPEGMTRERFEAHMRSLARDVVCIVDNEPGLARLVEHHGRRAVLVSEAMSEADGLTVVGSLRELEGRFGELGAPEAYVMAQSTDHADAFEQMCGKARLNYSTANKRAQAWVDHTLRNRRYAEEPSLMRLQNRFKGLPAFIVGTGPSLDRNRHLLGEAKRKGLVIGINAAGAALPEAPHITLTIEAEDTRALIGDTRDSIRAYALSCGPEMMEHGAGPLSPVYVTNPSGVLRHVTGIPRLETSISASTTGTSLALILGCSPIVLVGQDLGFPDGRTYADAVGGGSIDTDGRYRWSERHRALPRITAPLPEQEKLHECEGWGGRGTVLSTMPWRTLRDYWSDCALEWEDVALINCTEGGARISRWAEAPLWWLLSQLETTAPTTAEIAAMMREAGPLVAPADMAVFLAAQSVAARVVAMRAAHIRQLAKGCASTGGKLPMHPQKLIAWCWEPCSWAKAWTELQVNAALLLWQRLPPLDDEQQEAFGAAWALHNACEAIESGAHELSDRIREA